MKVNRRNFFKGLAAAGTLPLFNIGCAGFGEGRRANDAFDYNVPLAKTVMLGNVAARAGKGTLLWDGRRVTNNEKANEFLDKPYRKGWSPFV